MMNHTYRLKSFQIHKVGLTVAAVMLAAGCASNPGPIEQMATSREAVKAANSADSNEFAPLQLKSAMEKMDGAELAMKNRNYELARQLAEQAQVDAQLATTTAHSAKAQKAAKALLEDSRVLRQEIERNAK